MLGGEGLARRYFKRLLIVVDGLLQVLGVLPADALSVGEPQVVLGGRPIFGIIAQVQANMTDAVKTLKDIMTDKKAPASARVSAARELLAVGIRSIEIEDIEMRVCEIKEILKRKITNESI